MHWLSEGPVKQYSVLIVARSKAFWKSLFFHTLSGRPGTLSIRLLSVCQQPQDTNIPQGNTGAFRRLFLLFFMNETKL